MADTLELPDASAGATLELPSRGPVPLIREPAPAFPGVGPKSPTDILRDPRFAALTPDKKKMVMTALRNHITGVAAAPKPAAKTYPTAVQPGVPQAKPIMSEVARRAKMSSEAQQIMRLSGEMKELYNNRLKNRLDSGELSNFGQGARYVYPGYFKDKTDKDVATWITMSGQLGQLVNSYYGAASSARPGAQAYQLITKPHVPTAPADMGDLTGSLGIIGEGKRQWNISQQAEEMLPQIEQFVKEQEGKAGRQMFPAPSASATPGAAADPFGMKKYEK